MITAPDTLVISSKDYGAYELKKIIRVFTLRGFYYVMAFLILCIIAVFAFSLREKKVYKTPYRSMARLDMIDTPISEDAAPPPPPPEIIVIGTLAQAGNPVPVPDAMVAPDQIFASVDEISTSSSQIGDQQQINIDDLPCYC